MYIIFEYVQKKWVLKYFNRNNYETSAAVKIKYFNNLQ